MKHVPTIFLVISILYSHKQPICSLIKHNFLQKNTILIYERSTKPAFQFTIYKKFKFVESRPLNNHLSVFTKTNYFLAQINMCYQRIMQLYKNKNTSNTIESNVKIISFYSRCNPNSWTANKLELH
jgi:hypothetical protein